MELWRQAVNSVLKGRSFRQQQLPPKGDNMCVAVTAENFEQVVIRSGKDVLIIFNTPEVLIACKKADEDIDPDGCTRHGSERPRRGV